MKIVASLQVLINGCSCCFGWMSVHVAVLFLCLNHHISIAQQPDNDTVSYSYFDGTLRRIHVPILMYHYVSPLPSHADQYRADLTISPDMFQQHMSYLSENGYNTFSLYALHAALMHGAENLTNRSVILTFDDGYIDHFTFVFPTLVEFEFVGTFFVITEYADRQINGYLNWQQIREMHQGGMNIEAHTKTHPDLRNRDVDFLVYEILGSIESIRAHTESLSYMFAYPAGRFDEATLQVMHSMPVWRSVTTRHGAYHTTRDFHTVDRLRVSGRMGVAGLSHLIHMSR